MSQPLYFLPGISKEQLAGQDPAVNHINRALLQSVGLEGIFADVPDQECVAFELHDSPAGKAGCFLYYQRWDGRHPLVTGYKPTSQVWQQASERVWIGTEKDSPPTPEDLRRKKQCHGYHLELGEGQYLVPIVRRHDGTTNLPRSLTWDEYGNVIEPIKARYIEIWERFGEVAEWFFSDGWREEYKPKALSFAVEAIGLNYRFGRFEQAAMLLVDIESLLYILSAVVDLPTVAEMSEAQKKTE